MIYTCSLYQNLVIYVFKKLNVNLSFKLTKRKTEEIWLSLIAKPLYQQKSKKQSNNTKTPSISAITQRLLAGCSHQTGVINQLTTTLSHSLQQPMNQIDDTYHICK